MPSSRWSSWPWPGSAVHSCSLLPATPGPVRLRRSRRRRRPPPQPRPRPPRPPRPRSHPGSPDGPRTPLRCTGSRSACPTAGPCLPRPRASGGPATVSSMGCRRTRIRSGILRIETGTTSACSCTRGRPGQAPTSPRAKAWPHGSRRTYATTSSKRARPCRTWPSRCALARLRAFPRSWCRSPEGTLAVFADAETGLVTVVSLGRPDGFPAAARYGGAVQLLKSILTTMDVWTPEPGQIPSGG